MTYSKMIKSIITLTITLLPFVSQAQDLKPSFEELQEINRSLDFEITNSMYWSSYEYYYSNFQFPSTIDTFFNVLFENLLSNTRQEPVISKVQDILSANKPSFSLRSTPDRLLILYSDSIFFTFDKPFSCDEFNETGIYAGFVRNNSACRDRRANRLERMFKHRVWKCYVHNLDKDDGHHVTSRENSSLGLIGFTFDAKRDSLSVHHVCSYDMVLSHSYFISLKKLSRSFCRKNKYDGLFFSAPFVYDFPKTNSVNIGL